MGSFRSRLCVLRRAGLVSDLPNGPAKCLPRNLRFMQKPVLYGLAVLAVSLFGLLSAAAQEETNQMPPSETSPSELTWQQIKLSLSPEYFYWQENYNGKKLLDESGFRIGLEMSYKPPQEKGWIWASHAKLYFGAVDYNGGVQLANGTTVPLQSTTDYYGILVEAGYGYRFLAGEQHFLDVLGGLTLDLWLRRLGSQYGYDEYWFPISFKAGVAISPRNIGWIATLGLKVPVYTYETADLGRLGGGTVTLHPGTMVSGFAEAGYKFTNHLSLTAFFDSYWFAQSPVNNGFFQPESKSYEVGGKLGWNF